MALLWISSILRLLGKAADQLWIKLSIRYQLIHIQ